MADGDSTDWVWLVLESSSRTLRNLCRQLERLPRERLRRFQEAFDTQMGTVNLYGDWDAVASHVTEWPSEDGADDFAALVVEQGRVFHDSVRSNPDQVQRHLDRFRAMEAEPQGASTWERLVDRKEYRGYQSPESIALAVYRARFGEAMNVEAPKP